MPALAQREKTRKIWPLIILAAVPLAAVAAFFLLRGSAAFADAVAAGISAPVRGFLGWLNSHVHFSVMELLIVLGILWVLVHITRTVILLVRRKNRLRTLARRVLILIAVPAYVLTGYCYLWGACYYGSSFSQKSGISDGGVSTESLIAVATYFVDGANRLSVQVPRDADGHFDVAVSDLLAQSSTVYNGLDTDFGALTGEFYAPKPMLFSRLLSRMGFTGVYFALTGESNINTDSPRSLTACTIAHELAHQQGVASEDAASFVGIAACLTSGNTVYEYSGYLDGLINLMNALYTTDSDAYQALRSTYSDEVLIDLQDNNAYWSALESQVTAAATTVYDSYLKSNGQTSGILSYGECVNLLVAYYEDYISC